MDRGAWQATVHGVAKSQTQLSDLTFTLRELKTSIHKTSTYMSVGSNVIHNSQNGKQLQWLSIDEQINKMNYIHTIE